MNWIDLVFILIVVVSVVMSLMRGFVREALSLLVWILAFLLAARLGPWLGRHLSFLIHSPDWRLAVGEGIVFLVVVIAGAIALSFLGAAIHKSPLGFMDHLLGAIFGLARGVLFLCLLVWVGQLAHLNRSPTWNQSRLIPWVQPLTLWMERRLPTVT
jgi:membrane protein required for colicin V production